MKRNSANSLAPGFRFHPTDEELVRYYLKRKVSGKPFRFDPISETEIYKCEPWDLPDKSRLKTRDLEWYFFSPLDKKYGSGSKTNRATGKGYWKTTGKDRPVRNGSRIVGMKKTLVYHCGRAPRGERTNWVMHEYRLSDEQLEKAVIPQDAFVLCRIFQKSGSGPKNGEQYGAPFVEEEWEEDDEMTVMPDQEFLADEVVISDDTQINTNDLHQNLSFGISTGDVLPQSNFYSGETSNCNENGEALVEDNCKPQISSGTSVQPQDGQNHIYSPQEYHLDVKSVKPEDVLESPDDLNSLNLDDLLDVTFLDASDVPAFDDTPYLHTADPSNPTETNSADFDLDEIFNFFDADDSMFMSNDSSEMMMMMMGAVNNNFDESLLAPTITNPSGRVDFLPVANPSMPPPQEEEGSSLLQQYSQASEISSDGGYTLPEKTINYYKSLHAPPAFAAEFPSKEALLQLSSMKSSSQASSSFIQSTAGMLRIRNMTLSGNGVDWSFSKNGAVNLVLSFQVAQDGPIPGASTSKTASSGSWSGLCCLFLSAVFLPLSLKLGSYIWAR